MINIPSLYIGGCFKQALRKFIRITLQRVRNAIIIHYFKYPKKPLWCNVSTVVSSTVMGSIFIQSKKLFKAPCSDRKNNHGVEFRRSSRNALKIWRCVKNQKISLPFLCLPDNIIRSKFPARFQSRIKIKSASRCIPHTSG